VLAPLFSRDDDSVALVRSLDKRSRHGLLDAGPQYGTLRPLASVREERNY